MAKRSRRIHERKAEVFKAMGHPLRVAMVEFLGRGEQCVCDIAERVGSSQSNASRHLAVLHRAGIVRCRQDGLHRLYSLSAPCVLSFMACVSDVLKERMSGDAAALRSL